MRNLTVVGKFLTLTVLLSSLGACSTTTPYQQSNSVTKSAEINYANGGVVTTVYNLSKYQWFRLNVEQKRKQSSAVNAALQSEYGTVYNWYDHNRAKGSVKAVHGYPMSSGFCKVIYSTVTVKGKTRNFEETACQDVGHNGWRFIVR